MDKKDITSQLAKPAKQNWIMDLLWMRLCWIHREISSQQLLAYLNRRLVKSGTESAPQEHGEFESIP